MVSRQSLVTESWEGGDEPRPYREIVPWKTSVAGPVM
jgi:hypothetical protein